VSGSRPILILLLLVAVSAGAFAWFWQDPTDLPNNPGSTGGNGPNGQTTAGPASGTGPASTDPNGTKANATTTTNPTQPDRVLVSAGGDDDELCVLHVHVIYLDNGVRTPVTFTELTVALAENVNARGVSRTDGRGIAEFAFAGGAGETVLAHAATGGSGRAVLTSEQPTELEIVVAPRVMATGRVVDGSNVGVMGADIVLLRWAPDEHSAPDLWRIGQSGQRGHFRIPARFGGRIGAMHPDYASSAMFLLRPNRSADAPPKTEVFELVLQPVTVMVHGTVTDADNQPVANAVLEVHTATRGPSGAERPGPPNRVRTDANGNFEVPGLPPGDARWFARKTGHGWSHGTVTLRRAGSHRLDIQLPTPATVIGTVVDKDGFQPVAGATIIAGISGTLCQRTATSNADGSYELPDLGIGPTPVRAYKKTRSVATNLELAAATTSTWRAELPDASRDVLRGIVIDSRDQPLEGWTIVVRQGDLDPIRVRSEAGGEFETKVEQQQGLDVRAFAPGRPPTAFANATQRDVSTDTPMRLVVATRETTMVQGRVLDSNGSGITATIGCWHYGFREYARFKASADGTFAIPCPLGTVDLTIEHPGHAAHFTGSLPLTRGLPTDLGSITLQLGGGMFGMVMGPGGTPPPTCELKLLIANRPPMPAEFVAGSYRFRDVPAGEHTLVVQGDAIAGASWPIKITAGSDLERHVEVQQGWHRRIRVAVPPRGGHRVTLALLTKDGTTRWYATANVMRTAPGQTGFAIFETWMTAGTYEAIAVTPDGYEARANLHYQGTASDPFVMRVAPR